MKKIKSSHTFLKKSDNYFCFLLLHIQTLDNPLTTMHDFSQFYFILFYFIPKHFTFDSHSLLYTRNFIKFAIITFYYMYQVYWNCAKFSVHFLSFFFVVFKSCFIFFVGPQQLLYNNAMVNISVLCFVVCLTGTFF